MAEYVRASALRLARSSAASTAGLPVDMPHALSRHHRRHFHSAGPRRAWRRAPLRVRKRAPSPKPCCASPAIPPGIPGARNLGELLDRAGHAVDTWSPHSSKSRAPIPPKMWWRFPATARPSFCGTPWSGPLEAGARLAEPGEFTLRAFLNGRLDLPQAEAVRDLIEATTLYQARVAAQQAGGSVSRRIAPHQGAAARTDRAARSRHRFRRRRRQRRPGATKSCAASTPFWRACCSWRPASNTAPWCAPA